MTPFRPLLPVQLTGPWSVQIGPGTIPVAGKKVKVSKPVSVTVAPSEVFHKQDEKHSPFLNYNEKGGGWNRGSQLQELTRDGCAFTDLLFPQSVVVKPAKGSSKRFTAEKDYHVDPTWAVLGRIDGSAIGEKQAVWIDYDYCLARLDSITVDSRGRVRIVTGQPAIGNILPPAVKENEIVVANIWIPGRLDALTDENLFPIAKDIPAIPAPDANIAEKLLPKTLAKLRNGQSLHIVAWGDSVTHFCMYQCRFAEELRRRFPRSIITLETAAWPGQSSNGYICEPPGGKYDFKRDVLDRKPDLITFEFVNDAGLDEKTFKKQYNNVLKKLKPTGAEIIFIVPHFVRSDWMNAKTQKLDKDPRPYVHCLKKFAAEKKIALADTNPYWARLWREGIPFVSLHMNGINHPDTRGHDFFVQALTNLFPEK